MPPHVSTFYLKLILLIQAFYTISVYAEDSVLDFLPSIIAGVNKLPVPIEFKVAYPNISGNTEYIISTSEWDIPSNGTNAIKTTDNLQAAIDYASAQGYQRVVIPGGTYLVGKYGNDIYQSGLDLYSDTEYVLSNGATIEMISNNRWNYCVLRIQGQTDVTVSGGTIKGDRNTHVYTPRSTDGATAHDEGHGICVWGESQRVHIKGMRIHSLTGDGSLLLDSKDVRYTDNEIYNNRRQGVSVVGGVRVAIEDNEIHHIRGTAPQFGVDIEGAGREDRDIIIRDNYFHHNGGGDIVNTSGDNVYIINNVMNQGTEGSSFDVRYTDGPIVTWEKTNNVIVGNDITMYNGSYNGRLGFIQYSGGNDNNPEITYVHDNVCNNCGMYMYRAEGADIRNNKLYGYFLSLSHFTNVTLVDNLVTYSPDGPRYCWSYRFNNVLGTASGNYIEDQPANIPLSEKVPHTLQCVLDGF
ncbi:MAG: right-handed parallel beta-helix repeat-containing protein [Acidiferrobacterales bacterium]|nr:right-handed parallel beta-helix repeat-containing protein [Acidiferrobacterales bacterium]